MGRLSAPPQPLTPVSCFANKPKLPDFPTAAPSLPSSHMAQAPQAFCAAPAPCQLPPAPAFQELQSASTGQGRGRRGDASAFDCWWICSIIRMPSPRQDFGREGFSGRSPRSLQSSRVPRKGACDPARCCWLSSPTEFRAHQKRGSRVGREFDRCLQRIKSLQRLRVVPVLTETRSEGEAGFELQ